MLEDKQHYDFSHRAKVIEHEGERYYHSEWVATRDKVIERLQTEKSDLLSLIDKYKEEKEFKFGESIITPLVISLQKENLKYREALQTAKEALDSEYNRDGGIIKNNKAYMSIFNALEHEKFRSGLVNPDGGDYSLKWMSKREKE